MVHVEPVFFTIRIFAEGKSWGDEYKLVLTVQKIGETGFCSGCHGDFTMSDYREVERSMKEFGINKLEWKRNGHAI